MKGTWADEMCIGLDEVDRLILSENATKWSINYPGGINTIINSEWVR
jgi:hypothetical protein